jgi:hypothetical protein
MSNNLVSLNGVIGLFAGTEQLPVGTASVGGMSVIQNVNGSPAV